MNARGRGVVLQHQLHRRRQRRREVVATKMDARVATLRATTATPSPLARMNARGRGVVLIPTRRQPWCRARSLSQPTNRPSTRLEVVATKMDARVATLRATTATRMIRAVMNAQARGVVLQHQLHRRRQRRREVVATKMDARVAT